MQLLQTVIVGAGGTSNVQFDNLPQTATDLLILCSTRETDTSSPVGVIYINFNGVSTFTYRTRGIAGDAANPFQLNNQSAGQVQVNYASNGGNQTANTFSNTSIYIHNYAATGVKTVTCESMSENNATVAYHAMNSNNWTVTDPITSLRFTSNSNFAQNSTISLYSITRA